MIWKFTEARERFGEVVELALSAGPQEIETRTWEKVFLISGKDYARMKALHSSLEGLELTRHRSESKTPSFKEFLSSIPSLEGVDLTRDQ